MGAPGGYAPIMPDERETAVPEYDVRYTVSSVYETRITAADEADAKLKADALSDTEITELPFLEVNVDFEVEQVEEEEWEEAPDEPDKE